TVTDANSCTITDTVTILEPNELILNYTSTPLVCGNSLGSLTAVVSGGNGGYTYEWSDGSHEDHLYNLLAGDYNVAVWDNAGCSSTITAHVDMEGDISVIITQEHAITCYGFNDGVLSADSPNGDDPIEFIWSNGETVKIIDELVSGNYVLTVTDDWGCTGSSEYYLYQPNQISVDFNPTDVLCSPDSLGSIDATITGGIAPYEFIWSTNDSTSLVLNDLHHGQYIITVTDNNQCTFSSSVFIHNYVIPDPFLGHDTTLCEGDIHILSPVNDYAIYQWNNGDTTEYINVNEPGYYSLSVTDIHGCTESSSLYIAYAPYPEIVSVSTSVGTITVNAAGGSSPYDYSVNGDSWQQSNIIHNLSSDTYTVWVRDDNYCIVTTEVFLDQILIIPSFFTPNGDGYNEVWVIEGLYQFTEAEVFIYDRFGKKLGILYASDYGWNGHYLGELLPSDTYWYTIDLNDGSAPITGHVTIKR
ncbi:MAG: T9SS type B sorting domain-containing protein, partial [Bacteroidales bacterium]|nr:T9SS type B sorting domain-containing protein [Bacteroidales bacterium]